jgi:hypothetical protein
MIYCWIRDCYVEQNECCVLCKSYDEKTDTCKIEGK